MRLVERRRDTPGAVVAAVMFGLVVPFLPAATPPPEMAPVPPPVVQAVAARPVVLTDRAGDPPGDRTVALTFDDGPDPRWTPQVLDALRRHGAVATFCVVTGEVRGHEDLVRDVVAAGMRLCNHTRTHDEDLPGASRQHRIDEIDGARADLVAVTDAPVPYFRAPAGHWSPPVLDLSAAHGMQPLGWSVDPGDWRRPGVAAIVASVQKQVHPGAVVLMHDGGGHREQTVAALEVLLPWLTDQGYRFTFPTP